MILNRKKRLYIRITSAVLGSVISIAAHGQVVYPDLPKNRSLILVEEQFQQQHYVMAAQSCRAYLKAVDDNISNVNSSDVELAKFYIVVSSLKTNEIGSLKAGRDMIAATNNVAYRQRISFAIAQYYFQHNKMAEAIPFYENTGIANLTNAQIADEKFELAYCYFNNKQFDKAEPLFASIKELKDGKYYKAGNYYYGLLTYNENKYNEALQSFDRIKDDKEYRQVVPYYIAELYYFMGNKAKALEQAKAIMEGRDKSYYDNELHLLAAQCLFEDEKYAEAKPYFEYFYEHTNKITKEDLYKMAYCYYRINEWDNAAEKFKQLSNTRDSLGQSSMYLLGDCYLKKGHKRSARNAFGVCADMSFNKGQQESSMMLYARLSCDLGHNDEGVRQLNTLLRLYPKSDYKDEAHTLLSILLLKTNNFADALRHLDDVNKKDAAYSQVYQKAAYGFAVQQFREGNLNKAYTFFNFSLQHPVDGAYERAAYFWKGELAYRMHDYTEAIRNSQQFLDHKTGHELVTVISPQATAQHAYLNMGFAALATQNYSAAQTYFNHASQSKDEDGYSGMVATLHEADAVFMQQNYAKAIVLYDKIINTDAENADYARYQKSIIMGLQGKNNEKAALLLTLISNPKPSPYGATARYELAVTYIETNRYPQALVYLQQLTDSAGFKSFAPKAWMKVGFISQQTNDNSKAIAAYKYVVTDYPASDERISALDALRSLYIQSNQPAAYAQLLKENNLPSADSSAIDSTYYAAAETQFATGKWEIAKAAFTSYLQHNANGIFAIKAHYYRGESEYQLKGYTEALDDFNKVLTYPWNDFSENSARHAATISFDNKKYADAYNYYHQLRINTIANPQTLEVAYSGLIVNGYNSGKYAETGLYADSLLAMQGVSADMINDALLYKAKSFQHFDKSDSAINIYQQLSGNKNGEIAAESRYRIAEILVQKDSLKDAENAANETIKMSSGYDYWIVKSYILLADILTKQKDYFNAKATLESIVKHTKITELKDEATKKLADVKALEKQQSKLKED